MNSIEIWGVLILLLVLLFAIVGLIQFLVWLNRFVFRDPTTPQVVARTGGRESGSRHSLEEDIAAARRLINHLHANAGIDEKTYQRVVEFLDRKLAPDNPNQTDPPESQSQTAGPEPPAPAPSIAPLQPAPLATKPNVESLSADIVMAELVDIAPWDQPDPPPPVRRRTFSEILSSFMQEKNMRWGELTSGILIVLSAVGLVVSLREELSDAIPYFSSILFMAITGAIIGAGIYTLKKWKLRNTSRGTLVIGLLLIPLNFVAACVLSGGEERREISDPWLWAAILIGLGGFGVMACYASKFLFRKKYWPVAIAVLGCGAGTILLNRLAELTHSSPTVWLLSLPLVGSFLVGSGVFATRLSRKKDWSPRAMNRVFLQMGISAFAILSALSLLLIRAEQKMECAAAMTPVLIVVGLVVSRVGRGLIPKNERKSAATENELSRLPNDAHTRAISSSLVGTSLQILGLILSGIFLLGSLANPTVFAFNCLIGAIGLSFILFHHAELRLVPVVWGLLSAGVLAGLNVGLGRFSFDQWVTPQQLREALISGQSGLSLLACGVFTAAAQAMIVNYVPQPLRPKLTRVGGLTGGGIFLAGCLIALLASLLNRENTFDNLTASGLLLVAGLGLLGVGIWRDRRNARNLDHGLEHRFDQNDDHQAGQPNHPIHEPRFVTSTILGAGIVVSLVALLHGLLWNLTIGDGIAEFLRHPQANWVWAFAVHGMLLATTAAMLRGGEDRIMVQRFGLATCLMGALGAVSLMPAQTGNGTVVMLIVSLATGLIDWTTRRDWATGLGDSSRSEDQKVQRIFFQLATLLLVMILIGELVSRLDWCPEYTVPRHWFIQLVGIAAWSLVWTTQRIVFRGAARSQVVALSQQINEVIAIAATAMATLTLVVSLTDLSLQELVKGANLFSFSLLPDGRYVYAALAALAFAVIGLLLEKPTAIKLGALVVLWMLGWGSSAMSFEESRSAASAIRWLIPIGGILAAILIGNRGALIPAWARLRSRLRLSGRSTWPRRQTQGLIHFSLAIVVVTVLLISTVTVSQVLLQGADSLGGPTAGSWFAKLDKVVSFGGPLGLVVSTFLMYAISERREWLATAGSLVFQYMVLLSVVLLFLSPHPKLASTWFLRVLQSMSLGMTLYGFVWWTMRVRIGSATKFMFGSAAVSTGPKWFSQIETHTIINGLLISSLATLVFGRFFFIPDQPGAWINSVGSSLGVAAWLLFTGLAYVVWGSQQNNIRRWVLQPAMLGWLGMVLVAMIGAVVDFQLEKRNVIAPWFVFQVLTVGSVVVGVVQTCCAIAFNEQGVLRNWRTAPIGDGRSDSQTPVRSDSLSGWALAVGLLFAVRGCWSHPTAFWLYEALIGTIVVLLFATGLWWLRWRLTLASAVVCLIGTLAVVQLDPPKWFVLARPDWINLSIIAVTLLSLIQTGFYVYLRRTGKTFVPRSFLRLPNGTLLVGSIWVLLGSGYQFVCDTSSGFFGDNSLAYPLGFFAIAMSVALLLISLANDRRRFWAISAWMTSLGICITGASHFATDDTGRAIGVLFGCSAVVMAWGVVWVNRNALTNVARDLGAVRLAKLKRTFQSEIPIYSLLVGAALVLGAAVAIANVEPRGLRFLSAAVPLLLAIGIGCWSNVNQRRWLQLTSLALVTFGMLLTGWADLQPSGPVIQDSLEVATNTLDWLVRGLIVLAGAMFVYGGLVARWVQEGDRWVKSLREMAAVTCGLAVVFLLMTVLREAIEFREDIGCGLSVATAGMVALVVVGMIVGLISIAVRPQRDPFSLPLKGRQAYVYIAQGVTAGLVAHLYFSMPWLFQIGIKEYWPYVAMAICFGGVGVAHLLEKRNLTVLGQPIFTTAAIFPVLILAAMTAVEVPQVDGALVMLLVGLSYLMISYLHQSLLSGAAAILFGNLALWMFYDKFPGFSFFAHPQLWLIPPAVSVLVAGQLNRNRLPPAQLALLRYVCVAVIYVSSTSEIFISGLKDHLWPPIVLALLSVGGIMAGIGLQVRAFLYLGSLFLLTAMITMVAHAQQRLDHFWPWWAFGITLGIAILVLFGLFEKKKNEMKAIAGRLRDWD